MWIIYLRFSCGQFYSWKLLNDIRQVNLDVVTRYYRVAHYLCCYSWLEFYHTVLYCEYRVAFRCDLTADSRLHIVSVCKHGSLVELHGLTWIKLYCWLTRCGRGGHGIAVLATQEALPPLLPSSSLSAWRGTLLSGQSTDQTVRVLEGTAAPCRWLAVYLGLSNDRHRDNYLAALHHLRETCIRVWYRTISGRHDIARSTYLWSIPRYRIIHMNPKLETKNRKQVFLSIDRKTYCYAK